MMTNASVHQKWLDVVMDTFMEGIETDEREGVGVTVQEADVNAILSRIEDPDPTDVADAIWEAIPNAKDLLDEDHLVDLLDIVDTRWAEGGLQ
jgi:hypothetical protein